MTDQPIIYWQDDDEHTLLRLEPPADYISNADTVCQLVPADLYYHQYQLNADQARSLGYALIARAIVTEPIEQEEPVDRHYAVKVLIHVEAESPEDAERYVLDALLEDRGNPHKPLALAAFTVLETEEYIEHKEDRTMSGIRLG